VGGRPGVREPDYRLPSSVGKTHNSWLGAREMGTEYETNDMEIRNLKITNLFGVGAAFYHIHNELKNNELMRVVKSFQKNLDLYL